MIVTPIKTRIFKESEHLDAFIRTHIPSLKEGSVLVVTSKIVALAEGRTAVANTETEKEALVRSEGKNVIKTKWVWLALKDGLAMANAGIDISNGDGKYILLPRDSYASAKLLRKTMQRLYKVKRLGVLITDSHTYPLRSGVTGVALGYAGFKGVRDYRGTPDIFGRKFAFSQTNVADGLSAAAVLIMGEGRERFPLAVIEDAPVEFTDRPIKPGDLSIPLKDDMYLPFLGKLLDTKRRK